MMFAAYLLLNLAVLILLAWASPARGWRLALALLALGWVVGQANGLIEAVFFSVMDLGKAAGIAGFILVIFAVLAGLAVLIAWRWRGESAPPVRPRYTPLRLLGVVAGYELLYFGAGILVFSFVQHFYADKPLPSFGMVAGMQVARALIFAAAVWPWLRTGPRSAPLMLGIAFAVLGGVAPMLPDNPYMPSDVRLAHGIETSVSNFLFGLLTGWLLRARKI